MAVTSDIRVTSSSWVSFCALVSNSMASTMRRILPIWCSQTPPKWDACHGLNCHSQPCSVRYLSTTCLSISAKDSSNSLFAPTKLLRQSHLSFKARPRMEKNGLRAHLNELASIVSRSSMRIAPLTKNYAPAFVKGYSSSSPSCLYCPRSEHIEPYVAKGGPISALSGGKSAIFCSSIGLRSLLHVKHAPIRLATAP